MLDAYVLKRFDLEVAETAWGFVQKIKCIVGVDLSHSGHLKEKFYNSFLF